MDDSDGRLHAVVTRKGAVHDVYADPRDMTGAWASLYLGRVSKIDKKLDAAIVDLGNGLSGFLPAKHVHIEGEGAAETRTGIAELLTQGQLILVQIKAEAKADTLHEQHKLARLTTKIFVMGQHLLYSPVLNRVTISRMVDNDAIIAMTARLKGKGGWLVQSSAAAATPAVIEAEAARLMSEWQIINDARETSADTPRLLKAAPNALYRVLNDYGSDAFAHIDIGNRRIFDLMTHWCERFQPDLASSKRLRLFRPEEKMKNLFDMNDIFSALETLEDDVVPLPSGGSIIIETTHALTTIDVNQGAAATAAEANMDAAIEAARQIRMRNLSGAILIDFINMPLKTARYQLITALEAALKGDFAGAQVHGFTRLGIIEITRKRRTSPVAHALSR